MASTQNPYRKVTKLGKHSYYVLIPPRIIKRLGWRERLKVVVKQVGKRVMIQRWKSKRKS